MKLSLAPVALCLLCWVGNAQESPVVSLSTGYIYLNADQHGANRAGFNGWYLIPQYHATEHFSIIAEFTNFYGAPQGKSTNIHGYTAGPLYSFPAIAHRVTPFVFGEMGDVRTSAPASIANSFAFVAGLGANIKVVKHLYVQVIPGDYILTAPAAGVLHHYAAQIGLAYDLWSK